VGVDLCTAETRMKRRTACLQANVEFLQQPLIKLAREKQDKITAADRHHAAARAEIATLKSTMEKLNSELAQNESERRTQRQEVGSKRSGLGRLALAETRVEETDDRLMPT
jgi:chromosome segregation ATPase